jgi:hypothetical protein
VMVGGNPETREDLGLLRATLKAAQKPILPLSEIAFSRIARLKASHIQRSDTVCFMIGHQLCSHFCEVHLIL